MSSNPTKTEVKTEKKIFLEDAPTSTKQNQQEQQQKQKARILIKLKDAPAHRVSWTEDTIDNEHMNKKKSNLCCIYHRPGESSSDTCTSDDEGNALERDRHTKHKHKAVCSKRKHNCAHKKVQEHKGE